MIATGEDVLVLFIPGMLGSRLVDPKRDERVLWGEGRATLNDLVYNGTPARADLLESYETGIAAVKVYEPLQRKLKALIGARAAFEAAPYDWRTGMDSAAAQLDQHIRYYATKYPGRRLVLIGHSMGGLVAWTWLSKHYSADPEGYPELWRMWLAGSPVHGSCETLRILLDGYKPDMETGFPLQMGYRILFQQLRPAALTFPSIFQLLPDEQRTRCVRLNTAYGDDALDHFDIDVWRRYLLPKMATVSGYFFTPVPVHEQLRMKEGTLVKELRTLLEQARTFRVALRDSEALLAEKARFFYGVGRKTTSTLTLIGNETHVKAEPDGDGRVRGTDARLNREHENAHQVDGDHEGILTSNAFLGFIDDKLTATAHGQRAAKIAAVISRSTDLLSRACAFRRILDIDSLELPAGDPQSKQLREAVARMNVAMFMCGQRPNRLHSELGLIMDEPKAAARAAYEELTANTNANAGTATYGVDVDAALFTSLVTLLVPTGDDIADLKLLNRYGYSLLRKGRHQQAGGVFREAAAIVVKAQNSDANGSVELPQLSSMVAEGLRKSDGQPQLRAGL